MRERFCQHPLHFGVFSTIGADACRLCQSQDRDAYATQFLGEIPWRPIVDVGQELHGHLAIDAGCLSCFNSLFQQP